MINDLDIVQWDYLLSPEFEMINSAGKPLTGGYIEVYIHGTRNKYYCASDFNGTLHPFQIPLDSIGSNVILASPENAYDVYVYNKFGSLIMSRYNVHCQGGNGGSSTYVGDKLFYGQYRASNVTTIANLRRNKGNINLTSNGYLKLKNGMSYHITVRGAFQVDDVTNTDTTLNYIEYTSVNPIKIDIDETKEGPQYFELSYDIYRLPDDMDYQVAFAQSNGMVTELLVEVHSLSNLATSSVGGDQEYEAGWGIDITNNVISVDPSILEELEYNAGDYISIVDNTISVTGIDPNSYATHDEVHEATVTAIEYVTGIIPEAQVQSNWDETDDTQPSYIQNKPDLDIYATHDEVNNVSGQIIETVNNVSGVLHEEITNNTDTVIETINNVSGVLHEEIIETAQVVTSLIPTDYTTHEEVNEAIVTAIDLVTGLIPDAQIQSDWDQSDDTQVDYIKNKPDLDIYATHDEVNNVSGQIIETVNNVSGDIIATVNNVSGDIIETVNNVSGILHGEIENIPEQVQSDWNQSDDTQVDYIKNKPDLDIYATHDEVYESAVTSIQLVTGLIPDVSDFTTHTEVYEAVVTGVQLATSVIPDPLEAGQYVSIVDNTITVTGLQPEGDYATNADVYDATVTAVQTATGLIPDSEEIEFEEINLGDYALASAIPDVSDFTTHNEVNSAIVTAVNYVTALIPDAQVQSDWDQTDDTQPDYINNKPDLDIYVTHDELVEVVSAVTGIGDYGQFYATAVSGAAVMARTKGTIDVTNDGKIKLTKGSSYHVTVRGRYNQTTPNNVYSNISYIEYITFNNININVDKSITESQYFEISYDLYKLNSDTDYYIFFSGLEGTVNDLFIEIHAIGSVGAGVSGGAGTEYDAGWGIQILNNVISVDPSIFNDYVTENELVTAIQSVVTAIPSEQVQSDWTEADTADPAYIKNKPDNYNVVAGQNIGIIVSGSELIIAASGSDLSDYATNTEVNSAIVTAIEYVTGIIPEAQVQSDWTEDDTAEPSYIKHKPEEYDLVAGDNIEIDVVNNSIVISSNTGPITGFATEAEVYNAVVTGIQAATGVIPDSEEVQFEELDITQFAQVSAIPDVSDFTTHTEVYNAVVTGIQVATGLIPDTSDMATKTWVGEQGYLTEVPSTYATDTEVSEAIASSITDFVTEQEVTALIPESEEVQFEELDITQFAQASAIPVVTGFATKSELSDVEATIPTVQLNGDDQVTAINNHEIAGTGGTTYTAGDYISIENDEISVTGLEPLPEIVEMDALEIKAGTNIAIVTGVSDITISVTGIEIPDTSDMATKTWVGNQGYLTSIPDTYATDIEVSQAIASSVTGFLTEPEVTALIPESEDVTFEEINLANYALASAIPDVSNFVTDTEVTTEITEAVSGKQDLLTGITDVQVVTGLPASPTQDVLYLIVEA